MLKFLFMAGEMVTSTGGYGEDFARTDGRAYLNIPTLITNSKELVEMFFDFQSEASRRGRRRTVLRGIGPREVIARAGDLGLPIEVQVQQSLVDRSNQNSLVVAATNNHNWSVPEWSQVYSDWQKDNRFKTPLERVQKIDHSRFALTNELFLSDVPRLFQLWKPFGWTEKGIKEFIEIYQVYPGIGWFSGVVDRRNNQLVSACKGERLDLAGVPLIEGTEEGTLQSALNNFSGKGLCTAAVVMLHAQIINSLSPNERPFIFAETNMTSRADIVSRHAGMTAPEVEGICGLETSPRQVLKANVSVLDGKTKNNLRSQELKKLSPNYQYWRNFLFVVLSEQSIQENYSGENLKNILSYIESR